jgi:FMN phosphatase YigB (HAD superfamily)
VELMALKAIVFDLDDTLTDNKLLDLESFRYLSRSLGLYTPKMREIIELRRRSLLAKDIISWMINRSSKLASLEICIEMRRQFLKRRSSQELIRLKPNLFNILKRLKLENYFLIIVTSRTETASLASFLKSRKLDQFFKAVYDSNSGTKSAIYNGILQNLKLAPNECLVVANTLEDLLPAIGLGMRSIGIKGSYGFDPALQNHVKIIANLNELTRCIEETTDGL